MSRTGPERGRSRTDYQIKAAVTELLSEEAVLKLLRTAIADPGQFLPRGDDYSEPITSWSARAVVSSVLPLLEAGVRAKIADELLEFLKSPEWKITPYGRLIATALVRTWADRVARGTAATEESDLARDLRAALGNPLPGVDAGPTDEHVCRGFCGHPMHRSLLLDQQAPNSHVMRPGSRVCLPDGGVYVVRQIEWRAGDPTANLLAQPLDSPAAAADPPTCEHGWTEPHPWFGATCDPVGDVTPQPTCDSWYFGMPCIFADKHEGPHKAASDAISSPPGASRSWVSRPVGDVQPPQTAPIDNAPTGGLDTWDF